MNKWTEWFILAVICLIGGILLFSNLELYDIWGDEALTFPKGQNFGEVIQYIKTVGATVHPPVYSLVQYGWMQIFAGWDLGANRFIWAFFGFLCLPAVYLLGRELFNRNIALTATVLCALSPFFIQYSRMVRYYSLTALLAILTLWAFSRLKRSDKWSDCILFAVSGTLFIYEDYLAVFVFAFLYLYLLLHLRKYRDQILKWLVAAGIIFVLFLPWLPNVFSQAGGGYEPYPEHVEQFQQEAPRVAQKGAGMRAVAVNSFLKLGFLSYTFTLGETTYFWRWGITLVVILAFAVSVLASIVNKGEPDRIHARFLAFVLICLLVTTVVISEIYGIFGSRMFQFPSKVMFLLPIVLILTARGMLSLGRWIPQTIIAVVLIGGNAYGLSNYYNGQQFLNPKFLTPWRQIQADIASLSKPQDLILTDEEAFLHNLRVTNFPVETFGLVGAVERVAQVLDERGQHQVYLVVRYRGDQTIVMEGMMVRDQLRSLYPELKTLRYVPADSEAAPYWKRFLGRDPYPYLVEVYRFAAASPSDAVEE